MLLAGDEFGRTQGGNNNAYCQDSEIGWINWQLDDEGEALLAFTRALIALRSDHIVFHRNRFFLSQVIPGTAVKDVVWLRPDGAEMTDGNWQDPQARTLGIRLSGEAGLLHLTARGEQEPDETFLLLINASHQEVPFTVPAEPACRWQTVLDTGKDDSFDCPEAIEPGSTVPLTARSLRLYRLDPSEPAPNDA